jgi:hypothetical protein
MFLTPLQDVNGELSLKIWLKKKKRISNAPIMIIQKAHLQNQ